jgi:hypothetical protein
VRKLQQEITIFHLHLTKQIKMQSHVRKKHPAEMAVPMNKRALASALKMHPSGVTGQFPQPFRPGMSSGPGKHRSNSGLEDPFNDTEYSSTTNGSVSQSSTVDRLRHYDADVHDGRASKKTYSVNDAQSQDENEDTQLAGDYGFDGNGQVEMTPPIDEDLLATQAASLGYKLMDKSDPQEFSNNGHEGQWPEAMNGAPSDDPDETSSEPSDRGYEDESERGEERQPRSRRAPNVQSTQQRLQRGAFTHAQSPELDYGMEHMQEVNKDYRANAGRIQAEQEEQRRREEHDIATAMQTPKNPALQPQEKQQGKKRKEPSQNGATAVFVNVTPEAPRPLAKLHQQTLTHRGSSTTPMDRESPQLPIPSLSDIVPSRGVEPTAKTVQLDYSEKILKNMTFDNLAKEHFDNDPAIERTISTAAEPLENRLSTVASATHIEQQHLFATMTMQDWQASGEWFKEQFASLNERMLQSRAKRRQIAHTFEAEVAARYEAVIQETNSYSKALEGMNSSGRLVLEHGTPKRGR